MSAVTGVACALASLLCGAESNTHFTETDVIRVSIGEVEPVVAHNEPVPVAVEITNRSDTMIAGNLTIGGPTKGLYPIGETSRKFELEPGQQLLAEFKVAFDQRCLSGVVYPVHAFVQLTDGRDARVQVVRLIETRFKSETPAPVSTPETPVRVRFTPGESDTLGPFDQARTDLLTSFIRRSEQLPKGVLAYRLGSDASALSMIIRPGSSGLLDGEIAIVGPEDQLVFGGLEIELELPPGATEDGATPDLKVVNSSVEPTADGFTATHQLQAGDDWTTQIIVHGLARGETFDFRLESIDRVVHFRLGKPNRLIRALAAGPGYTFPNQGAAG